MINELGRSVFVWNDDCIWCAFKIMNEMEKEDKGIVLETEREYELN